MPDPFVVKDATLLALVEPYRARDLPSFAEGISKVRPESLLYHFWRSFIEMDSTAALRPWPHDFSRWVAETLQDLPLAEELSVLDPSDFPDVEGLRQAIMEAVQERIEEGADGKCPPEKEFHFCFAQALVFPTETTLSGLDAFLAAIPDLAPGSLLYHIVYARQRTGGRDDFSLWLETLGEREQQAAQAICAIRPYGMNPLALRQALAAAIKGV